jgi:hypothetical protein
VTTKNPNMMLHRIRSCASTLSRGSPATIPPALQDLLQTFKDLDSHLSRGGAAPDDWCGAITRATTAEKADLFHPVEDIIRRM